jgi:hypothetical protein
LPVIGVGILSALVGPSFATVTFAAVVGCLSLCAFTGDQLQHRRGHYSYTRRVR